MTLLVKVKLSCLFFGVLQASCNPQRDHHRSPKLHPTLSLKFHPVSSRTSIPPPLAFASCAPPRFDEFSDKLIGTWSSPPTATATATVPAKQSGQVEEVMRACGGAVQGIREMPLQQGNDDDRLYHNRAHDGFVFLDDGSYIAGPVQLSLDGDEGIDVPDLVASLSFQTLPRTRSIVMSVPRSCEAFVRDGVALVAESTIESNSMREIGDADAMENVECSNCIPEHIQWEKESSCRMPSSSQPWMMQRVKWETFVSKTDEDSKDGLTRIDVENMGVNGWVCTQMLQDMDEQQSLWSHPDIGRLLKEQGSQSIIQMGCISTETMEARAFLRCHDDQGKLNAVVYQEGRLVQPQKE